MNNATGIVLTKYRNENYLLAIPGVHGVGVNLKERKIRVYAEPLPSTIQSIPPSIEGIPVEIVETGVIKAFATMQERRTRRPLDIDRAQRFRPAPGGVSCVHYEIPGFGTLGGNFYDVATGQRVLLSNNHVIANADLVEEERAFFEDPILQPGRGGDGGQHPDDTIATLYRWVPISREGSNLVDCAIGLYLNQRDADDKVLEIGLITGLRDPAEDMHVRKSGRRTGLTEGTITDIHATVNVQFWQDVFIKFQDQIVLDIETMPGDSGSLFVNEHKVVGLHFAGARDQSIAIANKARTVFEALEIYIKPPSLVGPSIALFGLFGAVMAPIVKTASAIDR